jgi:uncharacterized protein YqkB
MKIFDKDSKINFVDDNNVLVGFDDEQCCCENFGYFLSRSVPKKIEEDIEIETDGFNFDTEFFEEVSDDSFDCGGMVIFRLVKDDEEIFLALYNSHNGYYSHGFDMEVGGQTIHGGIL